jgi:hypothetical protein
MNVACRVEVNGKGMPSVTDSRLDEGAFMPEAPVNLGRSCRALRSLDSTLLACSSKRRQRQRHPLLHPPSRADLSPTSKLPSAPSLTQQYRAGTCREHAQAKYAKEQGHADFTLSPSSKRHPVFTLHRRNTRARNTTHKLVHCLLHPLPPPHELALSSSSFAPPHTTTTSDHRCLALLAHCTPYTALLLTNTTPHPNCLLSQHDFFGTQTPLHVQVKTDRHSIQPAL